MAFDPLKHGLWSYFALLGLSFGAALGTASAQTTIYFAPGDNYYPAAPTETMPNPPEAINTLIAEYEAAHPDVNIELVEVPANVSSDTWRVTAFQGGTEPHILANNYIRVWAEAVNNWYLPLNDLITQPNPYIPEGTPGHEAWQDAIPQDVWDTTIDPNGQQYVVTVDAVATGMFYNKEIFEAAGLPTELVNGTSLWNSWAEMIADLGRLQKAGHDPLALSMSTTTHYGYNWIDGIILTSIYRDKVEGMFEPGAPWHAISQEEIACAVQNGLFSANDPEYADFLRVMQEFEPYWLDGYTAITDDEAYRLFIGSEAPMLLTISTAYLERALADADFDFGITYFPPLNGDTSAFAQNVDTAYLAGGPTAGYAITERAEREGVTPQVADFLMFLTAQPQWSRVIQDSPRAVPTLKGLEVPEAVQSLTGFLSLPTRAFKDPDPRLSNRYGEEHRRLMQEFFTGQIDEAQLVSDEDRLMQREALTAIASNGWTCDFTQ